MLFLTFFPFALLLRTQPLLDDVPRNDLGWPAQPPFISFLAIGSSGKMAVDPSARPAGLLAETTFEELRVKGDAATESGDASYSIKTRFDEHGRPTEEVRTQNETTTTTITEYQRSRILRRESTAIRQGHPLGPKRWDYWKYDDSGKLADFRRGEDDHHRESLHKLQT